MKRTPLLIVIAAIVVFGALYAYRLKDSVPATEAPAADGKNVDLMESATGMAIVTEADVEYYAGAKGYFARPEAEGPYPGVVMIHENRGLRPETTQAADELAKEGFMVLAVDLLGGVAEDQEGARALTAKFDQAKGVENMRAATAFLRERGAGKVASLGWCFGGRQSVELAVSGETLDATVLYYGSNMARTTERLAPVKWPVLGIFGDQDQAIPLTVVEEFRASLDALGVQNEIHVYPGVGHAFANPSGANYAPEPTKDAWAKTLEFLKKNLQ